MTIDIATSPSSSIHPPGSSPRSSRVPSEVEDLIFQFLLDDHSRQTGASFSQLSKDHYIRFTPLLWHTIILDKHSAKHFGAFIERDVTKYIRRIVFADPPKNVALGTPACMLEWEKCLSEARAKAAGQDKGKGNAKKVAEKKHKRTGTTLHGSKKGNGKRDDMDWYVAGVWGSMRQRFPSLAQVIITRSFTISLIKYIAKKGGLDGPKRMGIEMVVGPRYNGIGFTDALLPKWATFARELILESGPYHSVFWDLDFPFTLEAWLEHDASAKEADYHRIASTGAVRDVLQCLLGTADIREDEEYMFGEQSHLLCLTLWNYQILQPVPTTIYCDALHVVVAQHVQSHQQHIASFIGGVIDFMALELTFEKILEANANKLLVQGLPGLDDAEVNQAAEELVFSDCRGGKQTFQRVVDKVRFGPRNHATFFANEMFDMHGSVHGPLDFVEYDTPNLPAADAEPDCDPAEDLDEAKEKSGEKGYYDESTLEWMFEKHAYQLGPEADEHMSFWEWQKGDEYNYEDSEDEMDEMDGMGEDDEDDEDGEDDDSEDDDDDSAHGQAAAPAFGGITLEPVTGSELEMLKEVFGL